MRKLTICLLVLAMLAAMLCIPTLAFKSPEYLEGSLSASKETVTLTLKAVQDTNSGRVSVSYDADKLELQKTEVTGAVQDTQEKAGKVTFGYADLAGVKAGETVAVLEFRVKSGNGKYSLGVSVLDFNGRTGMETALEDFDVSGKADSGKGNGKNNGKGNGKK